MTFDRIKRIWWNISLMSKGILPGKLFSCLPPCYIYNNDNGCITMGDNLSLSHNVTIDASNHGFIEIRDDVSIGQNTVLRASNHDHVNGGHRPNKIYIGDNVWIGANCVILPGVSIGSNSIIGAGSIVTKNMPAGWVCFGNPCIPHHLLNRVK